MKTEGANSHAHAEQCLGHSVEEMSPGVRWEEALTGHLAGPKLSVKHFLPGFRAPRYEPALSGSAAL